MSKELLKRGAKSLFSGRYFVPQIEREGDSIIQKQRFLFDINVTETFTLIHDMLSVIFYMFFLNPINEKPPNNMRFQKVPIDVFKFSHFSS